MSHRTLSPRFTAMQDTLALLVDASPLAIFALDCRRRVLMWNPAAERTFGWTAEEVLEQEIPYVPRERCDEFRVHMLGAMAGNELHGMETQRLRKDGTLLDVSLWSAPLRDRAGTIVGCVCFITDITERNRLLRAQTLARAEADAARAEAELAMGRLARLQSVTEAALLSLDVDKMLEHVASSMREAFRSDALVIALPKNGSKELVVRDNAGAPDAPSPRIASNPLYQKVTDMRRPQVQSGVAAADLRAAGLAPGTQSVMGARIELKGRVMGAVYLASAQPKHFSQADATLLALMVDRLALAIEHARLYEVAQQASRERQDLLAIVSHDLKTPISSIVLTVDHMLRRQRTEGPDETRSQQVLRIRRVAERMHHQISDLLDHASIEAGHLAVDRQALPIGVLVANALEVLDPLAQSKQQTLEFISECRDRRVYCDAHRIVQVLSNLVGNAIKFSPAGSRITIMVTPFEKGQVRFSISDMGPGIPSAEMQLIFDRYWTVRREGPYGHGLGLAIAKGIVEAHGGKLWAESEPGAGATFFFTLPDVAVAAEDDPVLHH